MSAYALRHPTGVITWHGRALVHDSREELEFLFPLATVVDISSTSLPTCPIKDHPDMAGIRFPLHREDFR